MVSYVYQYVQFYVWSKAVFCMILDLHILCTSSVKQYYTLKYESLEWLTSATARTSNSDVYIVSTIFSSFPTLPEHNIRAVTIACISGR